LGEEPVAFVVTKSPMSAQELSVHCRQTLAPYKVPAAFHMVDELPKTSGGKVLKNLLVKRLAAMQPTPVPTAKTTAAVANEK
jgi:long-chain acyl-CoA synthetase